MNTVKTWTIAKDELNSSDFTWLKNCGMTYELVAPKTVTIETILSGAVTFVVEPPSLKIATESDEQEVWLLLMYGDCAFLTDTNTTFYY